MIARMQVPRIWKLMVLCLCIALHATLHVAEAGLLRDREYFNIDADGFWMKGRCFMPGRFEIPDEYNLGILSPLDDFGCVVKNRRGEHRIRRREADVHIKLFWVIAEGGRSLELMEVGEKTCHDSRRCRASVEEPLPTGTPWPRTWSIVGLVAEICGQRDGPGRTGTRFEVHVGETPDGSGIHHVAEGVACR